MALDTTAPRPRRAIIAAGLGGLAAFAARSIGRPESAQAANGDPMILGSSSNSESSATWLKINANDQALILQNNGVGGALSGLAFSSDAIVGISSSASGVYGQSDSAAGVRGTSLNNGVEGHSFNAAASGVYGENNNHGYGVAGRSNAGPLVSGAGASAVLGDNTADGIGVWARSQHGTAVYAHAVNSDATAIKAQGRVSFSRSGRTSVPINASYVDVTVAGGLSSSASVLATLQAYRSGVYVAAVRTNYPSSGKARIYLNKVASTSVTTPVAWFVLG